MARIPRRQPLYGHCVDDTGASGAQLPALFLWANHLARWQLDDERCFVVAGFSLDGFDTFAGDCRIFFPNSGVFAGAVRGRVD